MKTIWKYILYSQDIQNVEMPKGAQILSVATQKGIPCAWVLVDEKAQLVPVKIGMVGTGTKADHVDGMRFVGTFQLMNGNLVFHVFVEQQERESRLHDDDDE